jgi:hypothetical protein
MVGMLTSGATDPRSGHTVKFVYICFFSDKHPLLKSNNKGWFAPSHDNVSE